jgi:hypothetical protein
MRFKTMTAAVAAMALASPTLAAPAAKLSLSPSVRAGAAAGDERLAGGGSGAIIAGLLALGIIAIPVVDALIDDDDDEDPVSP